MALWKLVGNLLIMLSFITISMVGHAVSTTCGDFTTIDTDGSCQYKVFGAVATADEAKSCCNGNLTYVMPRAEQVSDLRFFFKNRTDGPYMTSFSIVAGQLQIDGTPVAENLTDKWRNGVQPSENVPCIAAEYKGLHDYELYAADCSDPFKALCIRVTQKCSCGEQQECVGQFTNVCSTTCQNLTFVSPDENEDQNPDTLKELLAPILPVAIIILVILLVVVFPTKKIQQSIHPCFPQTELSSRPTTRSIERTHTELPT